MIRVGYSGRDRSTEKWQSIRISFVTSVLDKDSRNGNKQAFGGFGIRYTLTDDSMFSSLAGIRKSIAQNKVFTQINNTGRSDIG